MSRVSPHSLSLLVLSSVLFTQVLGDGLIFDHFTNIFSFDLIEDGFCNSITRRENLPEQLGIYTSNKQNATVIEMINDYIQGIDLHALCLIQAKRKEFLAIQEEMTEDRKLNGLKYDWKVIKKELMAIKVPSNFGCKSQTHDKDLEQLMAKANCYPKDKRDFAIDLKLVRAYASFFTVLEQLRDCRTEDTVAKMKECHSKVYSNGYYNYHRRIMLGTLDTMEKDLKEYKTSFPNGCGQKLKIYLSNIQNDETKPYPFCNV